MQWSADTNAGMLKRIVALLLALAALADRAALAPRPVRAYVLDILRQAEAVAQAFVVGMARDLGAAMPPRAGLYRDDPDDATRLALRLRVLALALASLAALPTCATVHGRGRIVGFANIETPPKPGRLAACRGKSAPTPDTS